MFCILPLSFQLRRLRQWGLSMAMLCLAARAFALPAEVSLGDLVQTYDGKGKLPSVLTNPPDLNVSWRFVDTAAGPPHAVTETVFQNVSAALQLSYPSISFAAQQAWGIGDHVQLAGSARNLESVDVVMVSWARAANYPVHAMADPSGWRHPVTLSIYDMNPGGVLSFKGEVKRDIFVPWVPLTRSNGDPYPHNGTAFMAHFDFPEGLALPERPMILVTFNTQSTGFQPIGSAGPYNQLNMASVGVPMIGSDMNSAGVLWVRNETTWSYPTGGTGAPMFVVKASRIPEPGTTEPPVNAGTWQATATIHDPVYEGAATATLVIQPAAATITLDGLRAIFDGQAKPIAVSTDPVSLDVQVTYGVSPTAPSALGRHPVHVEVIDPNYQGTTAGILWIGHNLTSWLDPWVQDGVIAPEATGWDHDPDGDGLSNLIEYGCGLDPSDPDHGLPGRGVPRVEHEGGEVSLTYRRNQEATDLEYQVEAATRLDGPQDWQPVATTDTILSEDGPVQTIRAVLDAGGAEPLRFLRLRIERR